MQASPPSLNSSVSSDKNNIIITGLCPCCIDIKGNISYDSDETIHFYSLLNIQSDSVKISGGHAKIEGDSVTFIFSISTSFNGFNKLPLSEGKNYKSICTDKLNNASKFSYEQLKRRHINVYKEEFGTTKFSLNTLSTDTTDDLLLNARNGVFNDKLTELLYSYGRYLVLCSSRKGTLPSTLQGIWNADIVPPWRCDYTININTQMNYWCVEASGLSDCHFSLFDFLLNTLPNGQKAAHDVFQCSGWCLCHNTDIWCYPYPSGSRVRYAFWPMGGAWLSRHIWEHFEYTGDIDFLKKYGIIITESAKFIESWFIEENGFIFPPISTSPENAFNYNGEETSLCRYSTMDLSIAKETLSNAASMCKIIGGDYNHYQKLSDKVLLVSVGKDGRLMEWNEEFDELEAGHRHISHLYGVYPSNTIKDDSKEFLAAEKSFNYRISNGGGYTGWSNAWNINMEARFKHSDKAYDFIKIQARDQLMYNLLDMHPYGFHSVFQIDGNIGFTAAINEMLVQNNGDTIIVLPCIPHEWQRGKVTDIYLKGGLVINFQWENDKITHFTIFERISHKPLKSGNFLSYPLVIDISDIK